MTEEEIKREGLRNVVPERKRDSFRKVTVAYLSIKQNKSNWKTAITPRHVHKWEFDGTSSVQWSKSMYEKSFV